MKIKATPITDFLLRRSAMRANVVALDQIAAYFGTTRRDLIAGRAKPRAERRTASGGAMTIAERPQRLSDFLADFSVRAVCQVCGERCWQDPQTKCPGEAVRRARPVLVVIVDEPPGKAGAS